ncbi:serine/threonine-protein phosphatase Pgam5, mitochondrial-like [Pectinophora gossypiella]|uniref:serine/threonine-protein phosphatase Pgam5, mitochondrial-like n=1 Tax=Pectinophora gossypiella TaxID=13191 RepID=UPI00214F44B2|nr:serine/threonine-protein phosphatase Pgam5, mitochondrial-like [Pectinophora gossypiella]
MVKLTKRTQALLGLGAFGGGLAYYYCYLNNQCPRNSKSYRLKNDVSVTPTNKSCSCSSKLVKKERLHQIDEADEAEFREYPKPSHNVFLIRHGEYDENGQLTEFGQYQAKLTAARLNAMHMRWQELVSSTKLRAQETASIIADEQAQQLAVISSELLDETNLDKSANKEKVEEAYKLYFHPPMADQKDNTYTILVGHGNVFRYFICRALGCPVENYLRITLHHGSITWITIKPNGYEKVWSVGEISHMPRKNMSYSNIFKAPIS